MSVEQVDVGRSRENPPRKFLAPGKLVISGRAASCNKPSTRSEGINLQQEVGPQQTGKISSRLPQPWPRYWSRVESIIQADRGRIAVSLEVPVFRAAPAAELNR